MPQSDLAHCGVREVLKNGNQLHIAFTKQLRAFLLGSELPQVCGKIWSKIATLGQVGECNSKPGLYRALTYQMLEVELGLFEIIPVVFRGYFIKHYVLLNFDVAVPS